MPIDELQDLQDWRQSVTLILERQTQILDALRQDFRDHEEKEEAYQRQMTKFMMDTVHDRATVATRTQDVAIDFEKFNKENANQHKSMFEKLEKISDRVWLATGAAIIYAPVIAFLAVELFRHLTSGE